MPYQDQLETVDITIANGASLSSAAQFDGKQLVAVLTPTAWTAAAITFQQSEDGTNYYDMADKTAELSIASAAIGTGARTWIAIDPIHFLSGKYLKLRSGTSATPVAQGGARTIRLILKPIV